MQLVFDTADPVAYIISTNIRRRHLTKQQQAALIVAAHAAAKPPQVEAVSNRGGRGKVNPVKIAAISSAKECGISKSTVERELARFEGKKPESSKVASARKPKPQSHVGIDAARRDYLERCAEPDVDLDAEQQIVIEAFREIAGKRANARMVEEAGHEMPDLPDFLDRKNPNCAAYRE
jgi:hypothetical protein